MPNHTKKPSVRVAIVEDDFATRKSIVEIISNEPDFEVVAEFGEGRPAISSLPAISPDVLLVDMGLPDISGIEVVRAATASLEKTDILVVTTFGDQNTIMSALEAGADGYILKGVGSEELRSSIRALRNGGSPLSPMAARSLLDRLNPKQDAHEAIDGSMQLSKREQQILQAIARGYTYAETSELCSIAKGTVHTHLKNIYRKLSVNSKIEAINYARSHRLIS